MDDVGDIGEISPRIAFPCDMKLVLPILSIPAHKQLQERIDVLCRGGGIIHGPGIGIRETDTDGLVEEDDVGVVGP